MSPFRRGTTARSTPPTAPEHGWAETRAEPTDAADAWAATRIDAATPPDAWAATRIDAAPPPAGPAATRPDAVPPPDGWSDTRAQTALATRFLGDDYADLVATDAPEIGRPTGPDVRELFVSCDPAEALQQQFEHLQPEFIAIHDLATAASRSLLDGVAAASARRVQRLVIRRQGYGTPLATLRFVDLPAAPGKSLRLYSTALDADADAAGRLAMARTLLGGSRLGVVMVGDLPAAALAAALQPFRDAMAQPAWRNRQLLLLPLAAAGTVASQGIALGQASGVAVRTTPQVARPADAWRFITAGWNRFGEPLADAAPPATAAAPRPMPPAAEPAPELLERYLCQVGEIAGLVGCCVFDVATGRVVAHAGSGGPEATQLALHGGQVLTAMGVASRSLGLGRLLPDAAITLGAHHLLLRGLTQHPALALHAVLDRHVANLTLARLQLERMDALLAPPAR